MQEPNPTAYAQSKSLLASQLPVFHWPKQVTWPGPKSMGQEIQFSQGGGGEGRSEYF